MSSSTPGKTGVLLVNLGTPDSPSVKHVRRYLREFLSDPRVIDINPIGRFFLVNAIIAPFRAPKSARIYKRLWTAEGSPLLVYGLQVQQKLQSALGDNFIVEFGMRYQHPSLEGALQRLKKQSVSSLVVIPLFPQYASSTTGSVHERIMTIMRWWWSMPDMRFISQFPVHPLLIGAFAENIGKFNLQDYDKVLFSYHGLPVRQVDKIYADGKPCDDHDCETEWNAENEFCYKATCYATTRAIAQKLGLAAEKYEVVFQSRLGRAKWLEPYAEGRIRALPAEGKKKILVCAPSFVADCLETTIEIGEEYKELFLHHGGVQLDLVPSLNASDSWIACLKELVVAAG